MSFNAAIYVSEQSKRELINMSQDLAHRCVAVCAERYNFDAEEAYRYLNLSMIKVERKGKKSDVSKTVAPKPEFPLPYSGEFNDSYCYALRKNEGLYTQCTSVRRNADAKFCKGCATTMQKTGTEVPEYGTIQQRMAVDIFEYVDPKGRKPVGYTKIIRKYKINNEAVLEEAARFNITVDPRHFENKYAERIIKRGRPMKEKEPKTKGAKGRPKKEKKVLMIDGDDDDLFATLVADANREEEIESDESDDKIEEITCKKKEEKAKEREAEKEAKRIAAEQAKAEKEAKLAAEKAEKEAKLAAEKAEKEQKKTAERLAREAKKAEEEAAKEAKRAAAELAKKEKEEKLAAEKAAKESKKPSKKAADAEEEEQPDVVKKIEFEGKKYLKSKNTGVVYDYNEYVKNGDQVVVGKWNDATNKIDFSIDYEEEEEEDEYEM